MILKALYDYYQRCGDLAPIGMEYKELKIIKFQLLRKSMILKVVLRGKEKLAQEEEEIIKKNIVVRYVLIYYNNRRRKSYCQEK